MSFGKHRIEFALGHGAQESTTLDLRSRKIQEKGTTFYALKRKFNYISPK